MTRPSTSSSTTRRRRERGNPRATSARGNKSEGMRPTSSNGSIRPTSRQQKRIPVNVDAWADQGGDEEPPLELAYTVFVYTGNEQGAETDANVFIELLGEGGTSGPRELHASWKNCFGQGSIDEFALSCADLGELQRIHIGHDSPSLNSGWLLERIAVSDSTGRHWDFACGRWLDKHDEDGKTEVTLRAERVSEPTDVEGISLAPRPTSTERPKGRGPKSRPKLVNSPSDRQVKYAVSIGTGDRASAGTESSVYLVLYGDLGVSKQHRLHYKGSKPAFGRGQTDTFVIAEHDVGAITNVRIGHDSKGERPGWFLDWVTVTNEDTGYVWEFNCSQWLASDRGDGRTVRDLTVSIA